MMIRVKASGLTPSRSNGCPMLRVHCPYCHHRMRVKGAHAGRFRPTCDRCQKRFLMILPPDPEAPPMITPLELYSNQDIKEESRAG